MDARLIYIGSENQRCCVPDRRGEMGDPVPNRVGGWRCVSMSQQDRVSGWACGQVCESSDQLATGLSD
jgi:hypothetical protein